MNDLYYLDSEEEKESENDEYQPEYCKGKDHDPYHRFSFRASTAPARPLTEIEEFRRSSDFLLIEHTVMCSS